MSLISRLGLLKEALFGAPPEEQINQGTAIISSTVQSYGVRPVSTFTDQITVYRDDPVVKEAILQMAQEIVSTGFFSTCDEAYIEMLPTGPGGRMWTAKEAIDYWSKMNNLDEKLLHLSVELVGFGNSFWNITNRGYVNIPLESISSVAKSKVEVPIREEYKLTLTADYGSKSVAWGDFQHAHTEQIGNGPLGSGIIPGLIAVPASIADANGNTLEIPSLYDIRNAIRASMKEGFTKFSFGNEMWNFPGMSTGSPSTSDTPATGLHAIKEKVDSMASTGQRVVTNVPGNIVLALPQRTQSYDRWIDQVSNEFLMALGNPSLKLGLQDAGPTKANAEAARAMFEMKVAEYRRIIKRHIEAIWAKVLTKSGFDSDKANMRLNFGSPEIAYITADIFTATGAGIITVEEARHLLFKNMKWDIKEKAPPELTDNKTADLEQQAAALKVENEQARKEAFERMLKG